MYTEKYNKKIMLKMQLGEHVIISVNNASFFSYIHFDINYNNINIVNVVLKLRVLRPFWAITIIQINNLNTNDPFNLFSTYFAGKN